MKFGPAAAAAAAVTAEREHRVAPIAPGDVGALVCRARVNVDVVGGGSFTLWRGSDGNSNIGARVLVRSVGGNLEIQAQSASAGLGGWQDMGFIAGEELALQVRYEPSTDIVDLWWGDDSSTFGGIAHSSADGETGSEIDGNRFAGSDGWDLVLDDWECGIE